MKINCIILTLNEAQHISRCLQSLDGFVDTVTIIDSGSTDGTVAIAESLGAEVFVNPWINYSDQLNYGIRKVEHKGGWLLRIDADEVLCPNDASTFKADLLNVDTAIHGMLVKRQIFFLGQRIQHGAIEPSWQLRLWRAGSGYCEQRWMDEHIQVIGQTIKSKLVIQDINLNSISWWTEKHNGYASREAIDLLNLKYGFLPEARQNKSQKSPQAALKRFLKENLYSHLPTSLRSFLYFMYRYIFRFGFLDGRRGLYFHFLQGFWYRMLVDSKIMDIEQYMAAEGCSVTEAIIARTGYDPLAMVPSDRT